MSECTLRHCDCWYENRGSKCWDCTRNKTSEANKKKDNYIDACEKVRRFYEYLKGEFRPKLSQNKAFGLIYYLQETMQCLPDTIEKCDVCGDLFNTDREGFILDDQYEVNGKTLPKKYWGMYCDGCEPQVDFQVA